MTSNRKSMPDAISRRCGSKVAWSVYSTREEAEQAASVAKHNARIDESYGYDWGFATPGEITKVEGGFEVCHP